MPAETKRAANGVYLLFLAERVTEEELTSTTTRYQQNADQMNLPQTVVVIDPIQLHNPLGVARLFPQYADERTTHYLIVNNGRAGAVLAGRLMQKLPRAQVELQPHQQAAVARAKALLGVPEEEDVPTCDYL